RRRRRRGIRRRQRPGRRVRRRQGCRRRKRRRREHLNRLLGRVQTARARRQQGHDIRTRQQELVRWIVGGTQRAIAKVPDVGIDVARRLVRELDVQRRLSAGRVRAEGGIRRGDRRIGDDDLPRRNRRAARTSHTQDDGV